MADQKTTQLNENTAPLITDLLALIDDPAGAPETQKIALSNLLKFIDGLTELAVAPADADTFLVLDSGVPKFIQYSNFGLKIDTGGYTGDGAISQGITGLGFVPIFVWTWMSVTDGNAIEHHLTSDNYVTQDADGLSVRITSAGSSTGEDNRIISLDADGFTVDDGGADQRPNKLGEDYEFVAWGRG